MDKRTLGERDVCTKYIIPAKLTAGWIQGKFREAVELTDGCVMVRGKFAGA